MAGSPVNEQSLGAQTLQSDLVAAGKRQSLAAGVTAVKGLGGGADGTFTPWEVLLPLPVGKMKGPTQS